METLTKEQRHEVYKLAKEEIERLILGNRYEIYSCNVLYDTAVSLFGDKNNASDFYFKRRNNALAQFKEFLSKKPVKPWTQDGVTSLWLNHSKESNQKRIEILTQCIEETK